MMKSLARWLVCGTAVFGLTLIICNTSFAGSTRTLATEEYLNPPPPGNPAMHFKAGTQVTLDDKGRVISGILSRKTYLAPPPPGNAGIYFKAGGKIEFDEKGYVTMGTLDNDTYLNLDDAPSATYKGGTVVKFNSKGLVTSGKGAPAAAPAGITDETSWIVNGHPVPWVFHANGTVEAPGLWKGNWTKSGEEYAITLTHKGASDSFTVKFSPDGKTFTAYKGGSTYRNGVRKK